MELYGEFTGPEGVRLRVPGFYDGSGVWKIRFAPTRQGEWSLRTVSSLKTLDEWAATAKRYISLAYVELFLSDPANYDHSEPMFRMVSLLTALQRHCGVVYDQAMASARSTLD